MAKQGPLSGQQVANKYRLGELLGSGGMGAVYKAQDTRLHRPVAMKVMSPAGPVSATDLQLFTQLFQAEALRLASLNHPGHPGIPDIYDYFEEAANWFLVMKFIEGETLQDYLQRRGGRLQVDDVLKIGLQLADVLHYLHLRQPPMIFRDLKPANVMIVPDGRISLIDFGIARLFTPGKSQDTFLFLSPGYAAPEQCPPLHTQTTPQSDVYSLGATLHHLLSGTDPVTSPFHFAPLPIQQPAQLASLIAQMVAIDPANRTASMAAVKDALQRMIDQTTLVPTVNVLLSSSAPTLPPTVYAQPFPPASALPPTQIASSEKPGTTIEIYRGHSSSLRFVVWSPDSTKIASWSEKNTLRVWDAVTGKEIVAHQGDSHNVYPFGWSPDGRYIASSSHHTFQIWDAITGKEIVAYEVSSNVPSFMWSPDGMNIALLLDHKVKVLEAATGKEIVVHQGTARSPEWSPDGRYIASKTEYDERVEVWDAITGKVVVTYQAYSKYQRWHSLDFTWSPDGRMIASRTHDKRVEVWDTTTGKRLAKYKGRTSYLYSLVWSPDGRYISSSESNVHYLLQDGYKSEVLVWDSATGKVVVAYQVHSENVNPPMWSPDGRHIAISAPEDRSLHIWDAAAGKEVGTYQGYSTGMSSVSWSPDGRYIVSLGYHDNIVWVLDAATGKEIVAYQVHSKKVNPPMWSPDGKYIASSIESDGRTVQVWDSATGKKVVAYQGHADMVISFAWSPDGRMIASASWDNIVQVWVAPK